MDYNDGPIIMCIIVIIVIVIFCCQLLSQPASRQQRYQQVPEAPQTADYPPQYQHPGADYLPQQHSGPCYPPQLQPGTTGSVVANCFFLISSER